MIMLVEDFTFEVLNENHNFLEFDCNEPEINDFLHNDALNFQKEQFAITYVFTKDNQVAAFFSLLNDSLHDKGYEKPFGIDFIGITKFPMKNE